MVYEVLKSDNELFGERRKAMCQYQCNCGCGNPIKKGEIYDSARGMSKSSRDYDGDYLPPKYWTFRTHLYHCGVPLQCQMGLHEFKYRPQIGDPNDFWDFDSQTAGTFCINCHEEFKTDLLDLINNE